MVGSEKPYGRDRQNGTGRKKLTGTFLAITVWHLQSEEKNTYYAKHLHLLLALGLYINLNILRKSSAEDSVCTTPQNNSPADDSVAVTSMQHAYRFGESSADVFLNTSRCKPRCERYGCLASMVSLTSPIEHLSMSKMWFMMTSQYFIFWKSNVLCFGEILNAAGRTGIGVQH